MLLYMRGKTENRLSVENIPGSYETRLFFLKVEKHVIY